MQAILSGIMNLLKNRIRVESLKRFFKIQMKYINIIARKFECCYQFLKIFQIGSSSHFNIIFLRKNTVNLKMLLIIHLKKAKPFIQKMKIFIFPSFLSMMQY
ncbi:hypothetical protein TTHERM_000609357 (macronuclear) [Tetrahymena thermophila SB210]|uniref:Uncharacterized protein n=1 Tax=Tetrahymena thermophila (strain SB210) TaxID=312017 RepID=W7XG08_TETTS|nr:hypothetical protein TTHERM_000609357 [Tetrahymena thermophila SB210]EWS75823.1 hypothetical protein TTHERM_000609357 [Tetrahymena thermophila SB210]|eukprot:XP_012651637.1 hypothetical protein TTHERM_000609357 [Tetrahymena thermophila SB210]